MKVPFAIPDPEYPCANIRAIDGIHHAPPDQIFWCDGSGVNSFRPGWYCASCVDPDVNPSTGLTLAQHFADPNILTKEATDG